LGFVFPRPLGVRWFPPADNCRSRSACFSSCAKRRSRIRWIRVRGGWSAEGLAALAARSVAEGAVPYDPRPGPGSGSVSAGRSEAGLRHKFGCGLGFTVAAAGFRFAMRSGLLTAPPSSAAISAMEIPHATANTPLIVILRVFITDSLLVIPSRGPGVGRYRDVI
jgi:hypothetical protein